MGDARERLQLNCSSVVYVGTKNVLNTLFSRWRGYGCSYTTVCGGTRSGTYAYLL